MELKMKISIIGTGAYGLALATMFNENNNKIIMWSRFESEVNNLKLTNEYKGTKLPKTLTYTANMNECIKDSNLIVIAIPVAFITETIQELKKLPFREYILGLDPDSAGNRGKEKLKRNLAGHKLLKELVIPIGKDINDLSKEEFDKLKVKNI